MMRTMMIMMMATRTTLMITAITTSVLHCKSVMMVRMMLSMATVMTTLVTPVNAAPLALQAGSNVTKIMKDKKY